MATTMKKSASSNLLLKPIVTLVKRFHLTIFFIFVIGCLAWAVLQINNILASSPDDSGYVPSMNAGSIDQSTLERIQALHPSNEAGDPPALPGGRINPFGE